MSDDRTDTITISREEYLRLRIDELKIIRLKAGGVDNWEWYGDSLNLDGDEPLEDAIERLKAEILGGDSNAT